MRTRGHAHRGRGGQRGHEPRARLRLREAQVLELATLGWSQRRIAEEVGITQAAVSKLLARVELRQFREHAATIDRQKARQMQRLDYVFAEAIRGWTESQADATRRRQRKTHSDGGGDGATIAELVTENQHGDPRFLEEARKALADQRRLWGLEAPRQLDVRAVRNPYADLTDDELSAEVARQQAFLLETQAVDAPSTAIMTEGGSNLLGVHDGETD
jgi:predicted transcriptional regulator